MKVLGTLKEWLEKDPTAWLTNKKFLQKDVFITGFYFQEKTLECEYPSATPDFGDPVIYFGNSCFYMLKGKFNWFAMATYYPSCSGGSCLLSNAQAEDPNWEEFDWKKYKG